jgi:hypothetical protein
MQRLQTFLGALYARAPDVDAEVFHLPSGEQCRRLRALELDLALLDVPGAGAEIETVPLFPGDPLVLFLPVHHPLADRPRVPPQSLAGRTLLTHPRALDPRFHDWLVRRLARAGYEFAEVAERGGGNLSDLLFAVAEGRGVAVAPLSTSTIAGDLARLVTVRPLDPPQSMPDSLLAWRSGGPEHLHGVLAAAREAAVRLREGGADLTVAARVPPGPSGPVPFLAAGIGPMPQAAEFLRRLSAAFAEVHGATGSLLDEVAESVARAVENARTAIADAQEGRLHLEARVEQRVLDVVIAWRPDLRSLHGMPALGPAPDAPYAVPNIAARLRFVLGG